jgi:alpha-galactosidase
MAQANRIVLIGAGSAMFGLGTLGDVFKSKALAGSHVVLHDINPDSLRRVQNIALREIQARQLPFTLSATTVREEALENADYCIISIEVGDRFELWEQDWKIPLQYGIRQVYGENGGPGGLFHSLRIIPPILEICDDINSICPNAVVFNYSNPMSRICLAIKTKFPDLNVIGLCHEVASLSHHLPRILETPLDNLEFKAGGLNHFSVLLQVNYRDTGKDAYPDVRERAPAYFENAPSVAELLSRAMGGGPIPASDRKWQDRGVFRVILEQFGYLPITDDSHFGEYIQWAHEVADHRGISDFYEWYKDWSLTQAPDRRIGGTSAGEGWNVVSIMEGIITDSRYEELAVNIPNSDLIDNLPQGFIVEVPAVVDKGGVHGIALGTLPAGIAGLLQNQVAVHELTVEAVLTRSRQAALQALLVDPVVDSVWAAKRTLSAVLELQSPYLDYLQ